MTQSDPVGPTTKRWLNRTIVGAGLTSGLSDLAYETTQAILPGFLAALGAPPAALGVIEGIADAVASFTKLAAGFASDRLGVRKSLVVVGYALTPAGQLLIALAQAWPLILFGRVVSWFGKGVRGPLRDTIIAESITPDTSGRAYGFHRAMDTAGAVMGPLLAAWLLGWAESSHAQESLGAFRVVLWLALIPGVLATIAFAALVNDDRTLPNKTLRFLASLRQFPPRFRRFLLAAGIFGLGDFSHTLLILGAAQLLAPELGDVRAFQTAIYLYVLRNVTQTLGSFPLGALADWVGHRRVLLGGYVLGTLTAAWMAAAFATGWGTLPALAVIFVAAGLYVAVQEALEPSLTAKFAPQTVRATGYGALGSVNGVGRLVSSAGVGLIWTFVSPVAAFGLAAAAMAAGAWTLAGLSDTTTDAAADHR